MTPDGGGITQGDDLSPVVVVQLLLVFDLVAVQQDLRSSRRYDHQLVLVAGDRRVARLDAETRRVSVLR